MKYKIAVIEEIHKDGLDLLEKHPDYEFELITDVSETNLIKKLPDFDACTLRVSKLDENILKHCKKLKAIDFIVDPSFPIKTDFICFSPTTFTLTVLKFSIINLGSGFPDPNG